MNKLHDQLWIGDISDARTRPLGALGITHVVTVCQDSVASNLTAGMGYDFFDMADGELTGFIPGDNSYECFRNAVDAVMDAVNGGETVFVHCHAGQSRSVCVCASAVAVMNGKSFQWGLDEVGAVRGIAPEPAVQNHGARYVAEHWGGGEYL